MLKKIIIQTSREKHSLGQYAAAGRYVNFYYEENPETQPMEDSNGKFDFLYFLCTQYFRTKALKERWISSFKPCLSDPMLNIPEESINLENLAHHIFWLFKSVCAYSLWKSNALTLLVNQTEIPFITSDQPVINMKADFLNLDEVVTELVFFYPISPKVR